MIEHEWLLLVSKGMSLWVLLLYEEEEEEGGEQQQWHFYCLRNNRK